MEYVFGLGAHMVRETVNINDVRRKIIDLTKPMAEIAKHIETTMANLRDKEEEIANSECSADDLKSKITIQVEIALLRGNEY